MNLQEQTYRIKSMMNIINEAKQVGKLYHFTNKKALESILNQNKLLGSYPYITADGETKLAVSTSRNKNLFYDNNKIRITLDGDKLSHHYKIIPFDYWLKQYNIPDNPQTVDEDEELILTPKGAIHNINNYILDITDNNITESKMGEIHNYNSFNELTDDDLYNIAKWGLSTEYSDSSCETPECAVDDFKSYLSKPYPKELGNVPEIVTIHRLLRLKNESDLNQTNLGISWFANPTQYEIPEFYQMLDHLKRKSTNDGNIYLLTATTNQSNIDIPRTLWQRSTQWWENEMVVKDESNLKLINIQKQLK
jgi:hypothetical protein